MSNMIQPGEDQEQFAALDKPAGRRDFLKWTGVGAAALFAAACDQEDTRTITGVRADTTVRADTIIRDPSNPSNAPAVTLNFTNANIGVLNFAYALEQLEAAFYTQVVGNSAFNTTFNERERRVLMDLRDHEVIHREFFQSAIPAAQRIGALTPMFAGINFANRRSVLLTARMFEDLGVYAYNGAAQFLSDVDFLVVAGKIVSVEARHAAAIRDLLTPNTAAFAPDAFDEALLPSEVLRMVDPFVQNPINVTNAPAGF